MYENKICREYRDGKVTKDELDECSTCDKNCIVNNGLSEASKAQLVGKTGEEIAEIYLIKNGYKILERNFSCRQGEIDIIARDIKEIVFVEVKTRTNKKYGEPIDSITYYKNI